MINLFRRLVKEEEGQGLVEYALILVGIVVVAIVAMVAFGEELKGLFGGIQEKLEGAETEIEGGIGGDD